MSCDQELEKSYCPPVDSALFAAVASDYDLSVPTSVQELRQTLDLIKDSAIQQEDASFDPTGTSNLHVLDSADLDAMPSERGTSLGRDTLRSQTEVTSMRSFAISSEEEDKISSASRIAYTVTADGSLELVGATKDDKVHLLQKMFSNMPVLDIEQTLKKSNGDINKAMDVLLNLAFFDETQLAEDDSQISIPKGIDGFGADTNDIGRQKGRTKKRNKNKKTLPVVTSSSDSSPTPNRWEIGRADIDFISSRTPDIPESRIRSLYNANGMSLPATIGAIADEYAPREGSGLDDDDGVLAVQLSELAQQFKMISHGTLIGLLKATSNMPSAASELAEALNRRPQANLAELVQFTAAPLNLDEGVDENEVISHSRPNDSLERVLNYEQAQTAANAHFAARDAARQQAAQASRRARSNPLFAGAAAYYHQELQEQRERAMQQLSVAADQIVNRQSSNCDLDLHGVTVANAVRITRERVEAWWDGLGDTRYVRGGGKHVHGGFKIVTGIGRHSQDGTSRLGPAVSKMLISEGWRFEVDRGCLLVTGRSRN